MKKLIFTLLAALCLCATLNAQTSRKFVEVYAEPDHSDWVYSVGQKAQVKFYAVCQNVILKDVEFEYSYGPEKLKAVFEGTVHSDAKGYATVKIPGAKKPGFQTVNVSVNYQGHSYTGKVNLGYDPDKIQPTVTLPDDFEEYWEKARTAADKVPMNPRLRYCEEESNERVDVYYVSLQAVRPGTHVYGVLTVPKTEGRKPAILRLPGAAVRSFHGPCELAYEGFVCLEIGVHGIPVDMPQELYSALSRDGLSDYVGRGLDNRDKYYYRRVYLSLCRAIDYLCSREDVDPERIAAYGGSQGGMLSIVAAALDSRISALFAYFPAFCDVTGYHYGRGGGWPHLFIGYDAPDLEAKLNTVRYYDTVNFARFVKVPGIYAFGYNDPVCCPTSTYSAYNQIPGPKQLLLARDTGHWLYPWQSEAALKWLKEQFKMIPAE